MKLQLVVCLTGSFVLLFTSSTQGRFNRFNFRYSV